jgi:uncharacterized protein DUF6714
MEPAELDLVRSTIRSAFRGVVLGNGVSIRQTEVIDRYRDGCTDGEFRALPRSEVTENWESIPDAELERLRPTPRCRRLSLLHPGARLKPTSQL